MDNQVVTFGCRLNLYESEAIKDLLKKADKSNTIVINTCAVTKEAERQAKQNIRKLRRENPDADLIVTGCSAQIRPELYADMSEVSQVIGNDEKLKLDSYLTDAEKDRVLVNDIMSVKETANHLISGFDGKVRAFVQIQNGCNHRCTFCTIPYGRGNSRSVPIGEIVSQVKILLENGYKEIAFTGVDITDYGKDLPGEPTLGEMIHRLFNLVPDLKRLRLSSLDAVEMDDALWKLVKEDKRLLPHFHLSLQAGDNLTLKRMKRRHLRDDAIEFCKRIRSYRPDAAFGADLIAGFPTETEEMFQNTLNIIDECGLSFLHVFPYSIRPGTPAARMPQVNGAIIKERAKRLREKGNQALQTFLDSWVGKSVDVLIEEIVVEEGRKIAKGKTNQFAPISIENPKGSEGDLITVTIQSHNGQYFIA